MTDEDWNENPFPLAYLITFRTYGTWLHGDKRYSVDSHGKNIYGAPKIAPDTTLEQLRRQKMKQKQFLLDERARRMVEDAIKDICAQRGYFLQAINVRSNHVHAVVSAPMKPERIANALKAYSTKRLKKEFQVMSDDKIWSRGRSRRYLWTARHVALAIEYVLYGQGDVPFVIEELETGSETRTK